jgi:hypothetical protein
MFYHSLRVSAKSCRHLLLAALISSALHSPALRATPPPVPPSEKVGLQKNGSVVLPDSQVIELPVTKSP